MTATFAQLDEQLERLIQGAFEAWRARPDVRSPEAARLAKMHDSLYAAQLRIHGGERQQTLNLEG